MGTASGHAHDSRPSDSQLTLGEARQEYFARAGFPPDGGYAARWVTVKLGPVPFYFPNTDARRGAVRYHDLHHVLTGYATDVRGESEIAAWEIASGCGRYWMAWLLNLAALALGLLRAPGPVVRAFARGRRSRNLYRTPWTEDLLRRRVAEMRRALALDAPAPASGLGDVALLAAWTPIAFAVLLLGFAPLALPIVAVWWLV